MGEAGGLFLAGSPALSRNCKLVEHSAGEPEYPPLLRHTSAFAERGWRTSYARLATLSLNEERVFLLLATWDKVDIKWNDSKSYK